MPDTGKRARIPPQTWGVPAGARGQEGYAPSAASSSTIRSPTRASRTKSAKGRGLPWLLAMGRGRPVRGCCPAHRRPKRSCVCGGTAPKQGCARSWAFSLD
eukprot:3644926-Pyramimonas_sp.AAC.1